MDNTYRKNIVLVMGISILIFLFFIVYMTQYKNHNSGLTPKHNLFSSNTAYNSAIDYEEDITDTQDAVHYLSTHSQETQLAVINEATMTAEWQSTREAILYHTSTAFYIMTETTIAQSTQTAAAANTREAVFFSTERAYREMETAIIEYTATAMARQTATREAIIQFTPPPFSSSQQVGIVYIINDYEDAFYVEPDGDIKRLFDDTRVANQYSLISNRSTLFIALPMEASLVIEPNSVIELYNIDDNLKPLAIGILEGNAEVVLGRWDNITVDHASEINIKK